MGGQGINRSSGVHSPRRARDTCSLDSRLEALSFTVSDELIHETFITSSVTYSRKNKIKEKSINNLI